MRKKARYYIGGGLLILLVLSFLYLFNRESPVGKNSENNAVASAMPSENKASENIPAIVKESHTDFIASIEDPVRRARYEAYTKTKRYQELVDRTLKSLEERGITFPSPEERAKRKELNKQRRDAAMNQIRESQASNVRKRAKYTQFRDDLQREMEEIREQSARRQQWLDKILSDPRSLPDNETPHQQADSSERIIDAPEIHRSEHTTGELPPSTWQETLTTYMSEIDAQYADVIIVSHLRPEEFDEYFPTKASREQLQARQAQMQSEIAQRIQRILTEDTGNREEKLSIIRQTLSENWNPDIAESVLEQLR